MINKENIKRRRLGDSVFINYPAFFVDISLNIKDNNLLCNVLFGTILINKKNIKSRRLRESSFIREVRIKEHLRTEMFSMDICRFFI